MKTENPIAKDYWPANHSDLSIKILRNCLRAIGIFPAGPNFLKLKFERHETVIRTCYFYFWKRFQLRTQFNWVG
jgi:hypothetical protein